MIMIKHDLNQNRILDTGKGIAIIVLVGLIVHIVVMVIDYFLVPEPYDWNLHKDFFNSIFSLPMLPMMSAYILFSFAIYFLWMKWSKATRLAQLEESQKKEVQVVLASMQRLTVIVADSIATYNTEIYKWIESKKTQGKPVSKLLQESTHKIAQTVKSLSEIAFLFPYIEKCPRNIEELEKELQNKMEGCDAKDTPYRLPCEKQIMRNRTE